MTLGSGGTHYLTVIFSAGESLRAARTCLGCVTLRQGVVGWWAAFGFSQKMRSCMGVGSLQRVLPETSPDILSALQILAGSQEARG